MIGVIVVVIVLVCVGINAVVTAAVLEGTKAGCEYVLSTGTVDCCFVVHVCALLLLLCSVIGIYEGWKRLREGKSKVLNFTVKDVAKLQSTGGSILRTSKVCWSVCQLSCLSRMVIVSGNCLFVVVVLLLVLVCFYYIPLFLFSSFPQMQLTNAQEVGMLCVSRLLD